jgi:hypothetical protein
MSRTSSSGDHRPLALPTPAGWSSRARRAVRLVPESVVAGGSCFQEFYRRTPAATTSTGTPKNGAASSAAKGHGPKAVPSAHYREAVGCGQFRKPIGTNGRSRGRDAAALDGCGDQRVSVTMRPATCPRVEPSPSAAWRAPSCGVVRRFRAALGTPWRRPQPRQVPPRVHRYRRRRYRGKGGRGHRPPDRRPLPTCGCPPSRMSSCDSVWRPHTAAREAPSLGGSVFVGGGGFTSTT